MPSVVTLLRSDQFLHQLQFLLSAIEQKSVICDVVLKLAVFVEFLQHIFHLVLVHVKASYTLFASLSITAKSVAIRTRSVVFTTAVAIS